MRHLVSMPLLPEEILLYHVGQYLEAWDMLSLYLSGMLPPSRGLYNRVFQDNTKFGKYTAQMFNERVSCGVYAIGSNKEHRLGTQDSSLQLENVGRYHHMTAPVQVNGMGDIITKIGAGQSIQILNSGGELYFTGEWSSTEEPDEYWPCCGFSVELPDVRGNLVSSAIFPDEPHGNVTKVDARWENREYSVTDSSDIESEGSTASVDAERIVNSPYTPTRFREVSSSNTFFAALDQDGLVWVWSRNWHPRQGIPVISHGGLDCSKIQPGTWFASFLVPRKGVYFWNFLDDIDSMCHGYPSFGNKLLSTYPFKVPGTNGEVIDHIVVDGLCVYLSSDGTVTAVDLIHAVNGYFDRDNQWSPEAFSLSEINTLGPFVQITASPWNQQGVEQQYPHQMTAEFGLVTQGGMVVVECVFRESFRWNSTTFIPHVFEIPTEVASVAVGISHYLALTKDGEVYSWGKEREYNGCLCLGTYEEAMRRDGVRDVGDGLKVDKPVRVDLPKRVYGICAGEDMSVFLM